MSVEADLTTMVDELTRLVTMIARASLRDHRTTDFASILTGSLAAAAANVGGPDALLAGRPGSWEASYIRELSRGAMSDSPDQWWSLMTEPVVVCLNVAELIEDPDLHPGLVGLDDARSRLGGDFDHHPVTYRGYEAALDRLTERYIETYALYAERFTAVVEAITIESKLSRPAQVIIDSNPMSRWWDDNAIHNSSDQDHPLARQIWQRAHDIVPLPNVGIFLEREKGIPS